PVPPQAGAQVADRGGRDRRPRHHVGDGARGAEGARARRAQRRPRDPGRAAREARRMNAPGKFLTSLAQSLSTMMLYPREHPTWSRAVDASYGALGELQKENDRPLFTFLGRDVVYGQAALHELRDWPWSQKLAEVGVQRLEFEPGVTRAEFEEFIADVLHRMVQSGSGAP